MAEPESDEYGAEEITAIARLVECMRTEAETLSPGSRLGAALADEAKILSSSRSHPGTRIALFNAMQRLKREVPQDASVSLRLIPGGAR